MTPVARRIREPKIETRTARLKLPIAGRPVFVSIARGLSLGYRRNKGAGGWTVRVADGRGGKGPERKIGIADDYEEADGARVLDFWQAQEKARAIARAGRAAGRDVSVSDALDQYRADLELRRGDTYNAARVRAHLPERLAETNITLLTGRDLRDWRDGLAKKLAAATVNRTAAVLRAALNLVADHDERIVNRAAWKTGLAAIRGVAESRNVILNEERVRTIVARAGEQSAEFGLLVEAAAVNPARMGQLARLEVQDLQDGRVDPRLMMPASRKGRGQNKISRRPVPITSGLASRLRDSAATRAGDEPLLVKPSGRPWENNDHSALFAKTAKATGLDPKEVTLYALRHSSIVRQLLAGVPVRVVAVNHDTSVVMIERTYSRHIGDHADALARKALLDLAAPAAGNVVPIAGAR